MEIIEKQLISVLEKRGGRLTVRGVLNELVKIKSPIVATRNEEAAIKFVRRVLNRMYENSSFHKEFGARGDIRDREIDRVERNRVQYFVYEQIRTDNMFREIDYEPIGVALSSLLTDSYFQFAMPSTVYNQFAKDVYQQAEELPIAKKLRSIIHVNSRGMQLNYMDGMPMESLDIIYTALLDGKKLKISYEKIKAGEITVEKNVISPIGIVYREPKINLLAKGEDGKVKPYIVQNMRHVMLLEEGIEANITTMTEWKKQDKPFCPKGCDKPTKVELEVIDTGNLIRDVTTFKLAIDQKESFLSNGNCKISLNKFYLSHDFINWLVARSPNVKVLKPAKLKNIILQRHKDALALYEN